MNQKLMRLILEQMGYEADLVRTGAAVLEKLEEQPYDIIFMDVEMPEMDGLEATRRIVNAYPEGQRPIIVGTTAYGLASDEHQCMEAGMNDCVIKPIRIEQIQECLIQWGTRRSRTKERSFPVPPEVIDPERLEELNEMERRAGKKIIRDLFEVYLEDLPVLLTELHRALASGDVGAAAKAAHRLKGTSLNVGANALANACRIIESNVRVNAEGTLSDAVSEVEQHAREAESALRRLMRDYA